MLYKEQIEFKLASTLQDYINAIQIHKDTPKEIEPIITIAKDSEDPHFREKIVYSVLDVVAENPRMLKTLIEKVLDDLVYTVNNVNSSFRLYCYREK